MNINFEKVEKAWGKPKNEILFTKEELELLEDVFGLAIDECPSEDIKKINELEQKIKSYSGAWFKPKKDKIKTLLELGYDCDESCDGILYDKWVEEDNINYDIQIHIEKSPITFMKTKTEGVFNSHEPIYITCEEIEAIYDKIQELKKEIK